MINYEIGVVVVSKRTGKVIGRTKIAIWLLITLLAVAGLFIALLRMPSSMHLQSDKAENTDGVNRVNLGLMQACPPSSNNPNCQSPVPPTAIPPTPVPPSPVPPTPVHPTNSGGSYTGGINDNPDNPNKRATWTAEVAYLLTSYQLSLTMPVIPIDTAVPGLPIASATFVDSSGVPVVDTGGSAPELPAANGINYTFICITGLVMLAIGFIITRRR